MTDPLVIRELTRLPSERATFLPNSQAKTLAILRFLDQAAEPASF
jgi:hypothetical protein